MRKQFSTSEKQTAWEVLDAMQDDLVINDNISLSEVLIRFNVITQLKNEVDVRKTEEKLPAESILPNLHTKKQNTVHSVQQFANNLRALLRKRQSATQTIKR